jgi:hypothetical protein
MAKKTPAVEEQAVPQGADPSPSPVAHRPSSLVDTRVIYCGDNLEPLAKLPDASVDLIYIDPPFNSNRNYNPVFKSPKGYESDGQITALEDAWQGGEQAEREFGELVQAPDASVPEMMMVLRRFLGGNDIMACLTSFEVD